MGIGEVVDHTLLEDGTINFYTAKFGNKTFKNVPASMLTVVKEQSHRHSATSEPKKKNKKMKEARTINVEPNWEGVYRFFKHMEAANPRDFKKIKTKLGSDWGKLEKMGQQRGW